MSSQEPEDNQPTPRRTTGRTRKPVQRLGASTTNKKKGKRASKDASGSGDEDDAVNGNDTGDDEGDEDAEQEEESSDEDQIDSDSDDDHDEAPKRGKKGRASQAKAASQRKPSQAGAKKRAPRKKKADGDDDDDDDEAAKPAVGKGDFIIEDDNSLFNAVRNPNSSLQTTADDWVQEYQSDAGPAMAELVNFLLRSCGCNATVDEHQAEDENGIVESLNDIQDEFKNETSLAYPIISKSKAFKKFRSSLVTFLSRLCSAAAEADILYSTSFCELFQAWVQSLSSSKIRAFRHTATIIALQTAAALNSVHLTVKKEHGQASRAKEAEEKKGRKDKARLKDLEKNVKAAHGRLTKLEEFLDSVYSGVFVNRYRDSDSIIRADCVAAMGGWMKTNPDYWLQGDYLRYIGWVLSDESKEARRESVKALFSLYAKDSHIGLLQHFTERFKGQLVQMAIGELDLAVRVQAIQVLRQIEGHGLLDEEQRDEVATLVYENERRVRASAADFFSGILKEEVETRETELDAGKAGKTAVQAMEAKEQLELKVLAELLVKYGRALDGLEEVAAGDDDEEDEETTAAAAVDVVEVKTHRGRIAFAVEALWEDVEAVRDWQRIMDFLLMDHSSASNGDDGESTPKATKGGRKGKATKGKGKGKDVEEGKEGDLEPACRLTEEEETLLVEVFVASLTRVTGAASAASTKKEKEKEDDVLADVTRAVIEALPRLFAKHQTVPARVVDILALPRLITLDMYLDMRMLTAYESLWDDVSKQFLKHTSSDVLDQAVQTIAFLLSSKTLGNTNTTKLAELEESLVSSLREAVAGKDIESSAFEEDEVLILTSWVARIDKLNRALDLSDSLNETDDAKQSSSWEIIDSLVERGRLGYKDEALMVEHALAILGSHMSWRVRAFSLEAAEADEVDYGAMAALVEDRTKLLDKLEEFSVGHSSNAAEGVKQAALIVLLDVHNLAQALTSPHVDPDGKLADLRLACSDELQARCAGYIEAEIERYSDELAALKEAEQEQPDEDDEESDVGSDSDDEATSKKKKAKSKAKAKSKKGKGKKDKDEGLPKKTPAQIRAERAKEQARLIASRRFERTIFPFVRALHSSTLDIQHASVLIAHFDRFSALYDSWVKLLIQDLRDEGIYAKEGEKVATVLASSLQSACTRFLESDGAESEEHLLALSRQLVQATVVRGAQLSIIKRLPTANHIRVHTSCLEYIVKKVAALESAKKTQTRNRALVFFKALTQLVLGIEGKNALTIKTSFDKLLEDNDVEVSASSKTWEPVRAYTKRLVTAMSKDPTLKAAAQDKVKKVKKARKSSGDVGSDDEDQIDEDADSEREATPKAAKAKAKPRASKGGRKSKVASGSDDDDQADDDEVLPPRKTGRSTPRKRGAPTPEPEAEQDEDEEEQAVASPAKKRKVESAATSRRGKAKAVEPEFEEEEEAQPFQLSSPPKKRAVDEEMEIDVDEEEEEEEEEEPVVVPKKGGRALARPPDSQGSTVSLSDVKRKNKRAKR